MVQKKSPSLKALIRYWISSSVRCLSGFIIIERISEVNFEDSNRSGKLRLESRRRGA